MTVRALLMLILLLIPRVGVATNEPGASTHNDSAGDDDDSAGDDDDDSAVGDDDDDDSAGDDDDSAGDKFFSTGKSEDLTGTVNDTNSDENLESSGETEEAMPTPPHIVAAVTVIGEKPERVPGASTLIAESALDSIEPLEMSEILRRAPGVHTRSEDGLGLRLNVGIRGVDPTRGRKVLVLEDGMPVAINPYGEPDLYYSPILERVTAIEVVKGSGAILFGPQTVAGTINFITRQPPAKREWRADLTIGERGYLRLLGRYGDRIGTTAFTLQVMRKQGDGFRGVGFAQTDIVGKLAFSTWFGGRATLKAGAYGEDSQSTYVGLTRDLFSENPYRETLAPHDRFEVARYELSVVHEQPIVTGLELRTLAFGYLTNRIWRRQDFDREATTDIDYERIVGSTDIPRASLYFRHTSTIRDRRFFVYGVEPRLTGEWVIPKAGEGAPPFTIGIRAGGRFLGEGARRRIYQTSAVASDAGDLTRDERNEGMAAAGYLLGSVGVGKLMLNPGFRVEHLRLRRDNLRDLIDGVPTDLTNEPGETSDTQFIPGFGAVFGPPRAQVFAGVHAGFAPPRIASSICPSGETIDIESEKSTNYEIGGRSSYKDWLSLEAAGFYVDYRDQVIAASQAGGCAQSLENAGHTRHMGVESAATFRIGRLLRLPLELDLHGTYTFTHASFATGENAERLLPYSPLHRATVDIAVETRFGLGGRVSWGHVSHQFTDAANTWHVDASGLVGHIPPQDTIDASVHYRIPRIELTLSLQVKNLLDMPYVSSRLPQGIHPQGYRQVMARLHWDTVEFPRKKPTSK